MPATIFRSRNNLQLVRASELPATGGVELLGVDDAWVTVQRVVRHPPQERDFVRLHLDQGHNFVLTAEHRLLIEDSRGNAVPVEAQHLRQGHQICTGEGYDEITEVESFVESRQVIAR